jgi:hypothetical protein
MFTLRISESNWINLLLPKKIKGWWLPRLEKRQGVPTNKKYLRDQYVKDLSPVLLTAHRKESNMEFLEKSAHQASRSDQNDPNGNHAQDDQVVTQIF